MELRVSALFSCPVAREESISDAARLSHITSQPYRAS